MKDNASACFMFTVRMQLMRTDNDNDNDNGLIKLEEFWMISS